MPENVRGTCLDAAHIGVDLVQTEGQLIGMQAFGPAAKLRALKLLDDDLKAFDLAVATLDNTRHVPDNLMQKRYIEWQIIEIEPHA